LAHKAEHAVDLDSGAVVAATLQAADKGDTATVDETLIEAGMAVAELAVHQSESHSGDTKSTSTASKSWLRTRAI
jgi:hypothetical protein